MIPFELIVHYTWAVLVLVWLAGAAYAKPVQRNSNLNMRIASFTMLLVGFFLIGKRLTPAWLIAPPLLAGPVVQGMGTALAIIGCAFAIWARLALGRNWSGRPMVKVGHELVVGGPYAVTRHPIYSGMLLASIGTALLDLQWWRILGVIIIVLALLWRMRVEEHLMIETFPNSYPSYQRRVRKLLPGVF